MSAQVVAEVKRLQGLHKNAQIRLTGHSLGAAMAQLTGMTLIKNGLTITQMISFGQPRIGDPKYAAFSDEKWST